MNESRQMTIHAGGKLAPIMPATFDDVARLAKLCVMAGMFQPARGDKDEDRDENKAIAQATMAILQGLESGIPPMQAVQQIAVINGRCTIWGDLVPALIWSRGHEMEEWIGGEGDDRTAYCEVTRGDNGKKIKRSFSVRQAKKAGLWDERAKVRRKNGKGEWYEKENDGPWFRFSERMLQMRARGFAVRDGAADVLRGMYIREEMEDEREVRDITPTPEPKPALVPPPPPPPSSLAIVVKLDDEEPQQKEFDARDFLADLNETLAGAESEEALAEVWQRHELDVEDKLSRAEREKAADLYSEHETRIRSGLRLDLLDAIEARA